MRLQKIHCWVVLAALLPQLTGCFSWHQVPTQALTVAGLKGTPRLRVATTDGWVGELWGPSLQESLLAGFEGVSSPEGYREILITSIQEVEERRFNVGRTLAMSAVGAGLAVGVVYGTLCFVVYPALGGSC